MRLHRPGSIADRPNCVDCRRGSTVDSVELVLELVLAEAIEDADKDRPIVFGDCWVGLQLVRRHRCNWVYGGGGVSRRMGRLGFGAIYTDTAHRMIN